MRKRALIVDVAKCINCNNCVLASKDEHVGNEFPGYSAPQPAQGESWIHIERHTRGSGSMLDVTYVPTMCNHCDDAPCIRAARDGAIQKRDDGVVIIDPKKARGRRELVKACPYGAISWNEAEQLPQLWTFDAHLLDQGWKAPRCVQACPTGALESIVATDAELAARVIRDGLEELRPELQTKPRVLYRNLARIRSGFIGGNIAGHVDGTLENIEGAHVSLSLDGGATYETRTDAFGDFKIDGLRLAGVDFLLMVRHEPQGEVERRGTLKESAHLGTLELLSRGA